MRCAICNRISFTGCINCIPNGGTTMLTATTTIGVMDAVIAIQSARQDDSNDVTLEQLYSSDDVDAIALAAKRTGCFVTFDYTDGEEIHTTEVY